MTINFLGHLNHVLNNSEFPNFLESFLINKIEPFYKENPKDLCLLVCAIEDVKFTNAKEVNKHVNINKNIISSKGMSNISPLLKFLSADIRNFLEI